MHQLLRKIEFLQNRVSKRLKDKEAKIQLLTKQWDNLLNYLIGRCQINKDKKGLYLCVNILHIPENIKKLCLKLYIEKCVEVHKILFQV